MSARRLLALLVGIVLVFIPAFGVVRLFNWSATSLVAVLMFYGCLVAGVWNQRRRGRIGGSDAYRGAMHVVAILAVIGFFGPFVYGTLTHTEPGNMAPIGGVLVMILGTPVAIGLGLIVYGIHE